MTTRARGTTKRDDVCLLTILQVSETLQLCRSSVYELIATNQLRSVDVRAKGHKPKTRVRSDDLQAFIDSRTNGATPKRLRSA